MENFKCHISSFRNRTLELLILYFVKINTKASLDNGVQFTQMLLKKFQQNNKFQMPRSSYENTLDELKFASLVVGKKTRREIHLLTRYEILQCGYVEKLKKRKSEDIDPVYVFRLHRRNNWFYKSSSHSYRSRAKRSNLQIFEFKVCEYST